MSRNTGSNASSETSWLKLYAAVAVLPLVLTACGGGGGGGSPTPAPTPTPTPSPSPAASLTVTSSATTTTPGGAAITLTATVSNSTATPTWTLSGPGTLSAASGTSITYTPPAAGSLDANATAIVSAALTGATTQTVNLTVTVPSTTAGLNWTNVTATSAGNLLGVDHDDGRFVAVSDTGAGLASTDGATWTAITPLTSNVSSDHLKAYSIAHLGNTFVAAGAASPSPYTTSTGAVASSTDGLTWTMGTLPTGATPIHGLIAGTRLVGLGETGHLYFSTDGATWSILTTISGPGTLNAGTYGAGHYLAVGDNGYIALSADSIVWQSGQVIKSGTTGVNLHGVAWTGTQFVAVGDNGAISTSPDGMAWSALQTSAITGALRSVSVSGTGLIVVVGDNGIETSTDGVTWTARNASGAAALNGVTYAAGEFVAVGASSAIKTSAGN